MLLFNKRKEKISMMNKEKRKEKGKKEEKLVIYNNKSLFFICGVWSSWVGCDSPPQVLHSGTWAVEDALYEHCLSHAKWKGEPGRLPCGWKLLFRSGICHFY